MVNTMTRVNLVLLFLILPLVALWFGPSSVELHLWTCLINSYFPVRCSVLQMHHSYLCKFISSNATYRNSGWWSKEKCTFAFKLHISENIFWEKNEKMLLTNNCINFLNDSSQGVFNNCEVCKLWRGMCVSVIFLYRSIYRNPTS